MAAFTDPKEIADYAERVQRQVPGLTDLHRMVGLLLAEAVPANGRVLVVGAGGGLELKALATMHPGWQLCGVDPSQPMLDLARATLGPPTGEVALIAGTVDDAPDGPFDGATCLLVLHFLPREERLRTLREIRRRLRPGAPLLTLQHSFDPEDPATDRWLQRYAAFQSRPGTDTAALANGFAAMKTRLPALPPAEDAAMLREAGFGEVELFYAALTFRGWIGLA